MASHYSAWNNDTVRSKMGLIWSNPWMARHFVWSFMLLRASGWTLLAFVKKKREERYDQTKNFELFLPWKTDSFVSLADKKKVSQVQGIFSQAEQSHLLHASLIQNWFFLFLLCLVPLQFHIDFYLFLSKFIWNDWLQISLFTVFEKLCSLKQSMAKNRVGRLSNIVSEKKIVEQDC